MSDSINQYGLKRYVPSVTRTKIRMDAGFGCVMCGCVLVDYEHIEPEFHNAKEHDPAKMTLLCLACHGRVSRKLIPKKMVWDAKSNPKSLQDGFVHDLLFVDTSEMEIKIGNSTSKKTKTILTIYGKPIIWFEPPCLEGEPSKLCAIFYDQKGKAISYINRNQFTALSSNQDIRSESTELSIVSNDTKCLSMDREGGSVLEITRMEGRYLDAVVSIDPQGALLLKQGKSSITLSELHVENCGSAIHLGNPPSIVKYGKLAVALRLIKTREAHSVENLNRESMGWVLDGEIFNKKYELVGLVRDIDVFSIAGEYVGRKVGSHIVYPDNCYETGEPIYTSLENIRFQESNPELGYDVSFRLFGSGI